MSAWPARLAARLVRVYQVVLRPLLPPACRFEPSCSEYSRQVLLTPWVGRRRLAEHPPYRSVPPLARRRIRPTPAAPSA